MAEQLRIEIDVNQARKALESLGGSFNTFKQSANNATRGASEAIKRLNSEMSKIKAVDPAVLSSLNAVNTALNGLTSGNLATLSGTLSQLGGAAPSVQATADALNNARQALANFQAPQGIDTVTVRFGNMANAANRLTPAQRQAQRAAQEHARAINDLGTELLNAGGFMAGIGVTAGRMAQSFLTLAQAGTSIGQIFAELSQRFGTFGAAAIAVTAAVVAFKGLYAAAQSIVGPIFEVGTQLQLFNNVLDSIDGKGAGAKVFNELKDTALSTGQSLMVLTDNYKGFRSAAQASGMEADQSLKIYKQFSTAFGAIGLNAQKTEKAFNAFTQMLSKGKVQAEELRGQLGDALPGAFAYAAQSMGVTTAALDGMLQAGLVLPEELLPKLAQFLENRFGDAVAKQAQSASAQLTNLGTRMTDLLNIMAQGNFGGVLGGLAEGFKRLNAALDSEAIRALAAVVGDLIGILANVLLSTLGAVVNGFTLVFDVIGKVINAFADFFAPVRTVTDYLRENNTVMRLLGGAVDIVGNALGAAIAIWFTFGGALRAATLASTVFGASFRGLLATITSMAPAVTGLTSSLVTYISGLRGVQAAQATTAGTALAMQTRLAMQGGIMATLSNAASGLANIIRGGLTMAFTLLSGALGVVGRAVLTLLGFMGTLGGAFATLGIAVLIGTMQKYGVTVGDVASKVWEWGKAMLGIQGPAKTVEQATNDVAAALNKVNEAVAKSPQKIVDAALAFQTFKGAAAQASQQMEALDLQILANEQAYSGEKDAINEVNKPLEDKKKLLKELGVELDASQIKLAAQASSLGMSKDSAIALAQQMKVLTMTEQERNAVLDQQIQKNKEYADFLKGQMDTLAQQSSIDQQAVRDGRMSVEEYNNKKKAIEELTSTLSGQLTEVVSLTAGQEGLRNAMSTNGGLVQSTKNATEELNAAYGTGVSAIDATKKALDSMNPAVDKTKTASEQAAEQQKKLGDSAAKTSEDIGKAKTNLEQTKTAVETMSASLTTAQTSLDTTKTSFESINTSANGFSTSVSTLTTNMPTFNEQLTILGGTVTGMSELLPAFTEQFNVFNVAVSSILTALPGVNEQIIALNTGMVALLPTTQQISLAFESIGAAGESLLTAQSSLESFVNQMTNSMEILNSFKRALDDIATASSVTVVEGFQAAMTKGDAFITKVGEIQSAIGNLITKMGELKAAAEAALEAAIKAQNASNNTDANVTQNREGGYSDVASRQRQTVDLSSFDNAPHFAEGTTNTSKFLSKVAGGGIPSILHPNEAVVPLSRGRKIPVDLTMSQITPPAQAADKPMNLTPMTDTAKALDNVSSSLDRIAQALARPTLLPDSYNNTKIEPVVNVLPPKIPEWKDMQPPAPRMTDRQSSNGLEPPSARNAKNNGNDTAPVNQPTAPVNITINVKTDDVDGFRRSKDQIARELSEKIRRANRRNG